MPDHDRQQPDRDVQGDLRGHRAELVHRGRLLRDPRSAHRRARLVPVERQRHRVDGRVQPAADADHFDAARPDRPRGRASRSAAACSTSAARASTSSARSWPSGSARSCPASRASSTSSSRSIAGALDGRGLGRDRRHPQGDRRRARGDLDDHAQLDRDLDRRLTCSGSAGRSRTTRSPSSPSRTTSSRERSCRSSGATRSCRRSTSASSSRSPRSSSTGSRSTGRRSATRCARSATTPRLPATAASPSRATTSSRWRSRARSPGSPARSTLLGWEYRINTNDVMISSQIALRRDRRRAARPQHGGRDRPVRAPVRRARDRHVDAGTSTRRSSNPSWRRT